MAFSNDLFFAPAHQLAAMLRKRDVSSVEMVSAFVERIEGSYSGVMGLPLYETAELLRKFGIVVP